jgi:hypothetical protein
MGEEGGGGEEEERREGVGKKRRGGKDEGRDSNLGISTHLDHRPVVLTGPG